MLPSILNLHIDKLASHYVDLRLILRPMIFGQYGRQKTLDFLRHPVYLTPYQPHLLFAEFAFQFAASLVNQLLSGIIIKKR